VEESVRIARSKENEKSRQTLNEMGQAPYSKSGAAERQRERKKIQAMIRIQHTKGDWFTAQTNQMKEGWKLIPK